MIVDASGRTAFVTVFVEGGLQERAFLKLLMWLVFLALFAVLAVRNAGRNSFSSYSFEWGIRQLFEFEEFDDAGHFSFGDIGSVDEYYGWLGNAALPGLYDESFDPPVYIIPGDAPLLLGTGLLRWRARRDVVRSSSDC